MQNYDLPEVKEGEIDYSIDIGGRYGAIPNDMIMSKFEETDIGDDEYDYDNYARRTLIDRRPDTNLLASEEPRGRVNSSSGFLNLRHYGHRGDANDAAHPEMFLGFGGEEDADQRGVVVDPDFKKLKSQHDARMRFVSWNSDADNSVTSGGRSESQAISDQQKVNQLTRSRFKQFTTSKDCRREGIRRTFKHNSDINKTILVKTFGEYITDKALNPQRKTTILSNKLIRNSKWYHLNTTDHEFAVARYGESGRKRLTKTTANHQTMVDQDGEFKKSDETKCFKNVGLLMSEIVAAKKDLHNAQHDIDFEKSVDSQARKHEQIASDLSLILREMVQDSEFKKSDISMTTKTAALSPIEHLARVVSLNHMLPASHYLNAELMYKAVKPGADYRKIKDEIVTDGQSIGIEDVKSIFGKSARKDTVTGKKESHMEVDGESMSAVSYKHVKQAIADERAKLQSAENFREDSEKSHNRRHTNKSHRATDAKDTITQARFHENLSSERMTAPMGVKSAVRRHQERDMSGNEIAAMS
jgi:hypothetical protein